MIKTIELVGKLGIVKDAQPQELAPNAWSDGANVRFRDGALERMKGEQAVFGAPTITPYWLHPYYQGGKRRWVHAGLSKVFADDGTTRTEITPAVAPTGAIDDRWTGGASNGVFVCNNGVDNPYYWGGTGVLAPLPGWPANTKASSVRPFKNVLVALDVTKTGTRYPHMVKWSDAAVPGSVPQSWDETDKTKLAGELDLAEDTSLLVDQLVMGDVNVIYKENAMYSMAASGGQDVFRFARLPGNVGALARGCIAAIPSGHVVLANGDVVHHSGQGPRSIISGRMRNWLFRTIDSDYRNRSFVVSNPLASEVWICFPEMGADVCTKAAVWNWQHDTWAIRELWGVTYGAIGQLDPSATATWDVQAQAWDDVTNAWSEDELSPAQERLMLCSNAPRITAADVTGTIDGSAYTSYVERVGLTFGDPNSVKMLRGINARVNGSTGSRIRFEVGSSMSPEQGVLWSSPVTYIIGADNYNKIDCFATGRFLAMRITSMDNQPWRITSLDVDVLPTGVY